MVSREGLLAIQQIIGMPTDTAWAGQVTPRGHVSNGILRRIYFRQLRRSQWGQAFRYLLFCFAALRFQRPCGRRRRFPAHAVRWEAVQPGPTAREKQGTEGAGSGAPVR